MVTPNRICSINIHSKLPNIKKSTWKKNKNNGDKMVVETLEEPIWEKQKGETPNQYFYFLEFLEYPTFNLKEFHQHLIENIQESTKFNKILKYQTIRKISSENISDLLSFI